jgi:hypothetical protein
VAAIVFTGKFTRNGWLLRPAKLTRIVELGRCGAAMIADAGAIGAVGARLPGAVLGGLAASGETAGLAGGLDSVVGAELESEGRASGRYSEPGVLSLEFSSEDVGSLICVVAG